MAPGGFTAYSIQENPMGMIDAFSLPEAEGCTKSWYRLGNVTHEFECISLILQCGLKSLELTIFQTITQIYPNFAPVSLMMWSLRPGYL